MDLITVNNCIVNMRKTVIKAKIHVIRQLCKQMKTLKGKKGTEEQKKKNTRKADRIHREMNFIKHFKKDQISKFALQNSESFLIEINPDKVKDDTEMDKLLEKRAFIRLSNVAILKKAIDAFRVEFPKWKQELPKVLQVLGEKQKFKDDKLKKKKKEEKKAEYELEKNMKKIKEHDEKNDASDGGNSSENDGNSSENDGNSSENDENPEKNDGSSSNSENEAEIGFVNSLKNLIKAGKSPKVANKKAEKSSKVTNKRAEKSSKSQKVTNKKPSKVDQDPSEDDVEPSDDDQESSNDDDQEDSDQDDQKLIEIIEKINKKSTKVQNQRSGEMEIKQLDLNELIENDDVDDDTDQVILEKKSPKVDQKPAKKGSFFLGGESDSNDETQENDTNFDYGEFNTDEAVTQKRFDFKYGRGYAEKGRGMVQRGRGEFRGRGGGRGDFQQRGGRGFDSRGRGSDSRGRGYVSRGRGSDSRGRGSDSRGRGFDSRGRGSDSRGRGFDSRGRGSDSRGRGSDSRGRGSDSRGRGDYQRPRPQGESETNLHPSWAAKRKQTGIADFQGKKIKFDGEGENSFSKPKQSFTPRTNSSVPVKTPSDLHPSWAAKKDKIGIKEFKGKKVVFGDD